MSLCSSPRVLPKTECLGLGPMYTLSLCVCVQITVEWSECTAAGLCQPAIPLRLCGGCQRVLCSGGSSLAPAATALPRPSGALHSSPLPASRCHQHSFSLPSSPLPVSRANGLCQVTSCSVMWLLPIALLAHFLSTCISLQLPGERWNHQLHFTEVGHRSGAPESSH